MQNKPFKNVRSFWQFKSFTHITEFLFVSQLQPVDSASINDIKLKAEGRGLFTTSAIVNMEWSSKSFEQPVVVSPLQIIVKLKGTQLQ